MRAHHASYIIAAALVVACVPGLRAQAPLWPPNGISPSPVTARMALPGGRFVPSTRRWNLVWADQIIPEQANAARVLFAANHYVGTQKIFARQADQFRAVQPNFLVLMYHLAAGLNPANNNDAPDPKSATGTGFIGVVAPKGYVSEYTDYFRPWLAGQGIAEGSARFESMFQHFDTENPQYRVWHQDPYWLMALQNGDWRRYIGETCMDWMDGNSNEGCFFDVAVETNVSLCNPKAGDPAPWDFNWWEPPHSPYGYAGIVTDRTAFAAWMNQLFADYFQDLYKRFHTAGADHLVIPNVDQMVTTVYDPFWTEATGNGMAIDGAMMEGFGSYRGADMWLTLDRGMRHITGRGKILIAQFGAADPAERLRRTAMFMLIKNENSFLNIINGAGVEWYPEYEIDLGDQSALPATLNGLRVDGSGSAALFARSYEHGLVLCNTSTEPITYTLPGTGWMRVVTGGGGEVAGDGSPRAQSVEYVPVSGEITVEGSGGVILRSEGAARVAPGSTGEARPLFNAERNVATGDFALRIVMPRAAHATLALYDILGREHSVLLDADISAGDHNLMIHAGDFPAGLYFCRLIADDTPVTRPLVITGR